MGKLSLLIFLVIILIACPVYGKAYKGLFVMTFGTKSHLNFFNGMTKALAHNGHEITFVSPFKNNFKEENIKEITVIHETDLSTHFGNAFKLSTLDILSMMTYTIPQICVDTLKYHEIEEALKEQYDYVIFSLFGVDCFLPFAHEKKIPLIYANPNMLMYPYSDRLGAPEFASTAPNKFSTLTFPMSFCERVYNIGLNFFSSFLNELGVNWTEKLLREMNIQSSDGATIHQMQKEASLAIINSVRALEIPVKSTPPTVIYAGGIHIQEPKSLPEDIKDWLDNSGDDGFILFSLGTGAKPEDMKHEHLQSILNVFRTLDQRIIWKWNAKEMGNLPPNVKLVPWLPQQDILAHPKIRLFITHGGLFSSQEATYFGVPIVGMPIFGDQQSNVAEFAAEGWGRELRWADVNENTFRSIVTEAMTNSTFREVVVRRSQLMKDWKTKPADEVVYWVEYVVRHNGAKHLQSPFVHMAWYEIYNIDAWTFIICNLIAIIIVFFFSLKFCVNLLRRKIFKAKMD